MQALPTGTVTLPQLAVPTIALDDVAALAGVLGERLV